MMSAETRQNVLRNIHTQLSAIMMRPPRGGTLAYRKWVDLTQIQGKLDEIKPFWDAYLAVSKAEDGTQYRLQNMEEEERDHYLDCKWWLVALEAVMAAFKDGGKV